MLQTPSVWNQSLLTNPESILPQQVPESLPSPAPDSPSSCSANGNNQFVFANVSGIKVEDGSEEEEEQEAPSPFVKPLWQNQPPLSDPFQGHVAAFTPSPPLAPTELGTASGISKKGEIGKAFIHSSVIIMFIYGFLLNRWS